MILFGKSDPADKCVTVFMFPNQNIVQIILLLVGVLCVPILLFGKPVYTHFKNKSRRPKIYVNYYKTLKLTSPKFLY